MAESLVMGGERVEAADGATLEVIEPAAGDAMGSGRLGGTEDATRAVDLAQRAFEDGAWPRMSARERGRLLTKASLVIRDRQEELATLEARNGGKPILVGAPRSTSSPTSSSTGAGAANKITGETIPIAPPGLDLTLREPVGVCALITPWNFPAVIASWKIAPRSRAATPRS